MAARIKGETFVVDASFVLAYLLPDERAKKVDVVFERYAKGEIKLISSQLLLFEVLNGLRSAVLQKRLEQKRALILAKAFLDLEIKVEEENFEAVFKLALKRKVTVYDAGYLWLALKKKVKLLSLDRSLRDGII